MNSTKCFLFNEKFKIDCSHRDISIVPILVGSLSPEREAQYGKLLAKYLLDPSNFFVVSSDFCHWGQRFRYTHYDKSCGEIYQSIQRLDQQVIFILTKRILLCLHVSLNNGNALLWNRGCQLLKRLILPGSLIIWRNTGTPSVVDIRSEYF